LPAIGCAERQPLRTIAEIRSSEGVDAKETKADAQKGEITVRIKGSDKVTTTMLLDSLKDAGIEAKLTKDDKKASG
jgi:hypothetical protein